MSGHAGCRDFDKNGLVIIIIDEKIKLSVAKGIIKGESDHMDSVFQLNYNMILDLLRIEDVMQQIEIYTQHLCSIMNHRKYAQRFSQHGHLVRVKRGNMDFG
ncbi:hypothetical protein K501DRAFT_302452 [Backusella circina FSU 941]|nr:hypothetical protein K501DRAFT_302452 [Backusella circina FSU 941]